MRNRINVIDVLIYIVITFLTLLCLVPVLNTFAMSLSDKTSAALGQVYLWPVNFTTSAYDEILSDGRFFTAFGVSIFRVILGVSINLFFTVMMAYPLSKTKEEFKGKLFYIWTLVFTMMFHGGIVPSFLLIKNLNLMDTMWALVLPVAVNAFNTILLMNFYKTIPKALEEAARVDGASPWRILIQIMIPLAKPAIATITLLAIVFHWNEWFFGKIYINSPENMPLQTYIQTLTVQLDVQALANMTPEEVMQQLEVSNVTFNSAKVFVSMIPVLVIYPFLQKYFVTGIVMGAVKE